MRMKDYPEKDGKRVWLGHREVKLLKSKAETVEEDLTVSLGVECGLRSVEIVGVTPTNVVYDDMVGPRLRIEQTKGDKYREVPMPDSLYNKIQMYIQMKDGLSDSDYLLDKTRRTIDRYVNRVAERCRQETGDDGWSHLSSHDLRRTWATLLVEADVEPGMIMEWGGWVDWETFREHYLGAYSPTMERKQAMKVPWLSPPSLERDESDEDRVNFPGKENEDYINTKRHTNDEIHEFIERGMG